jgi:hypothetical protein
MITVTSNAREATRWLQRIAHEQIPFATSKALNRTADLCRDRAKKDQAKRYKRPKKWVELGIRSRHSNKRQKPIQAMVYSLDEFQAMQETGGTKRPGGKDRKGRKGAADHLAVPARGLGKITKAKTPKALARKGKAVRIGRAIIKTKKARRRKGGGKDGRKRLFLLVKSARVDQAKPTIRDSVETTARRVYSRNFMVAYQRAIRDGKPKRAR